MYFLLVFSLINVFLCSDVFFSFFIEKWLLLLFFIFCNKKTIPFLFCFHIANNHLFSFNNSFLLLFFIFCNKKNTILLSFCSHTTNEPLYILAKISPNPIFLSNPLDKIHPLNKNPILQYLFQSTSLRHSNQFIHCSQSSFFFQQQLFTPLFYFLQQKKHNPTFILFSHYQ